MIFSFFPFGRSMTVMDRASCIRRGGSGFWTPPPFESERIAKDAPMRCKRRLYGCSWC